jgi:hypothetical protein
LSQFADCQTLREEEEEEETSFKNSVWDKKIELARFSIRFWFKRERERERERERLTQTTNLSVLRSALSVFKLYRNCREKTKRKKSIVVLSQSDCFSRSKYFILFLRQNSSKAAAQLPNINPILKRDFYELANSYINLL